MIAVKVLNLANKITILRILMTPIIIVLLSYHGPLVCWIGALAFMFASATDWADGYIARKWKMVTSLGKFLDPLADKILICSTLIMFVELNWVPAWVIIVIVCRELMITGLRAIAVDEGIVIPADNLGKLKTVLQIIAIVILIIHYPFFGIDVQKIGMIFLYAALALTVFSGANYMYSFYRISINRQD